MLMTLRQMLDMDIFKDMEVLAGHEGLDVVVKSVTVMDAPDAARWMKGGEILMSSGYLFKDNPQDLSKLLHQMHQVKAAALFIKVQRFLGELPQEVLDTANEISFPIVCMPKQLAWIDVINPVLNAIINEQAKTVRMAHDIHDQFTKIVVEGGDISRILQTLQTITKRRFVFWDMLISKQFYSDLKDQQMLGETTDNLDDLFYNQIKQVIREGTKLFGYLFCLSAEEQEDSNENLEYIDLLTVAMEHAVTVIKMFIQKRYSNLEIENRYRNEFVMDLLTKNIRYPEEIHHRATIYGWQLNHGRVAVRVDIDDFKIKYKEVSKSSKELYYTLEAVQDRIFHLATSIIEKTFPNTIYASFSDNVVFLIEYPDHTDKELYAKLAVVAGDIRKKIAESIPFTVTIAIGNAKKSITDIHKSFEEVKKVIQIGRLMHESNIVLFYKDLGIYELLADISDSRQAQNFCKKSLEQLRQYDEKHNTNLMLTLFELVGQDWNQKKAAENLYIHYNTMKYRYKKIQEVLNENLEQETIKTKLSISVKLYHIMEKQEGLFL